MNKVKVFLLTFLLFIPVACAESKSSVDDSSRIEKAFKEKRGDLQVRASGKVIKVLPDDLKGSKHQRFIIKLKSGLTLLVAHNIDLAPRVADLKVGEEIEFYGEYEWNSKGGVIHWTHKDPGKKHVDGWLIYKGKKYW